MLDESKPVEEMATYELVDILIQRGKQTNGLAFVTRRQIRQLIDLWRKENDGELDPSVLHAPF
jgi:hypothetical protein